MVVTEEDGIQEGDILAIAGTQVIDATLGVPTEVTEEEDMVVTEEIIGGHITNAWIRT